MTTITSLYNGLPALEEATAKFINRARIFSELALLLATYEHNLVFALSMHTANLKKARSWLLQDMFHNPSLSAM
jgi:hypothetical protein